MSEPSYLLVRGADLVVLGLDLTGFAPGLTADLRVAGPGARIQLTFPPQAMGEQKAEPLGAATAVGVRLAGPSRVAFDVPEGTSMRMTVEGVLAVAGGAVVVPGVAGQAPGPGLDTGIEMPWRLLVAPAGPTGAGLATHHPVTPVAPFDLLGALAHAADPLHLEPVGAVAPRSSNAVWATRVDTGPGSVLQPLAPAADDLTLPDQTPLSASQRALIVTEAEQSGVLPDLHRLELSALGGSLTTHADWGRTRWDHDLAWGRDQTVTFVQAGVMYPTGHRAQLSTFAVRRLLPDPGGEAVAQLRFESVLEILEPVRRFPADGSPAMRRLPFDELEITTTRYVGVTVPDRWDDRFTQPPEVTDPFQQALDALTAEKAALEKIIAAQIAAAPPAGWQISPEVQQARADLAAANGSLADAEEHCRQWDAAVDPIRRQLVDIDRKISDAQVYGTAEELDQLNQQRASIQEGLDLLGIRPSSEITNANAAILRATQDLDSAHQQHPDVYHPPVGSVDDLGTDEARRFRDLRDRLIPEARRLLAQVLVEHNRSYQPSLGGAPIRFPVLARNRAGDVHLDLPLRFVADLRVAGPTPDTAYAALFDPFLPVVLQQLLPGRGAAALPGSPIDLVRSPAPVPGDVHEVHHLVVGAALAAGGGFLPKLDGLRVRLPAVRTLLPRQDPVVDVVLHPGYLEDGVGAAAVLALTDHYLPQLPPIPALPGVEDPTLQELVVDFTRDAERSGGLVGPRFALDAISRLHGPVNLGALPGAPEVPDFTTIFAGAKILGVELLSLLPQLPLAPPLITQAVEALGHPPTVTMTWPQVQLTGHGPFVSTGPAVLDLTATIGTEGATTTCTLRQFALQLPVGSPLLRLDVERLEFRSRPGREPHLELVGPRVEFLGDLQLVKELASTVDLGAAAELVHVSPAGITAGYSLEVPDVEVGAFSLRNIDIHAGVDVPFTGAPVTVQLGFASRERPFEVGVLTFGGGGYLDIVLDAGGLRRLEASLDFGAQIAVNLGIASAEVHALGGVRYLDAGGHIACSGFLRIGGSVDILGLVSVSVNLLVELTYEAAPANRLVGRATLIIEIDLTIWSDSIELDSGTWVLAGGSGSLAAGASPEAATTGGRRQPLPAGAAPDAETWTTWWEAFDS